MSKQDNSLPKGKPENKAIQIGGKVKGSVPTMKNPPPPPPKKK